MDLVPITRDAARRFVYEHHGHNGPPVGWLFGVSLRRGDEIIGVAMAGRPIGRKLQDGVTIEVTRVCIAEIATHKNAASKMYGALCRAGAALGYRRAITYTLERESAVSVRAAGFTKDKDCPAHAPKRYTGQGRYDSDLFGTPTRPEGAKVRWVRWL